jgi:hypothetical protein
VTVAAAESAALYPTARSAGLTTGRSSLDLLELPYPFSQVHLLTVSEFAGMAGKRCGRAGRRMPAVNDQILEELHRCGVLVPAVPGGPGARLGRSCDRRFSQSDAPQRSRHHHHRAVRRG